MSVEGVLPGKPLRLPGHAADRVVALNALFLVGAYVLPRAALFGSSVIAARTLGGNSFGAYSTAGALAVILSIIATAGMQPLLVREMSTHPGSSTEILRIAHRAKLVTGAIMLVSAVLVALVLDYPPALVAATLTLSLAYAIGSFAENYGAWFQAQERMHVWTQATTIFGIVAACIGIAAVLWTRDVLALCIAHVLGQCAALAWLAQARRRFAPHASSADRFIAVTDLLRLTLPFGAAFLALTVFYKIDMLVLERMRGSTDAGIYGAAYRMVDAMIALALAGIGAAYPRLARNTDSPAYGQRAVVVLASTALVCSIVTMFTAPRIIGLLFGYSYSASAAALSILAAAFPALTCNLLAGYLLGAEKTVSLMTAGYASGTVLKLLLLAVMVPAYGTAGAAGAMLVSEVVLCTGFLILLYRRGSIALPLLVFLISGAPVVIVLVMRGLP